MTGPLTSVLTIDTHSEEFALWEAEYHATLGQPLDMRWVRDVDRIEVTS